ncbi:uncharacterized protein LOC135342344 isoform X3 [Halichondria panicea]|uniref:uncharacterized protein LOC135342344 isoform X3 n=1 Tax=Halichondria panicea TaxID=6063 RepID=UPI00312B40AC
MGSGTAGMLTPGGACIVPFRRPTANGHQISACLCSWCRCHNLAVLYKHGSPHIAFFFFLYLSFNDCLRSFTADLYVLVGSVPSTEGAQAQVRRKMVVNMNHCLPHHP